MRHNREGLAKIRWGTHLPLLTKYLWLAARDGQYFDTIVEHGAGDYSSPVITQFCRHLRVRRVCVETNGSWSMLHCGGPETTMLSSVDAFARLAASLRVGVALIDGDTLDRSRMIELCRRAHYLVVHDTESPEYGYDFTGFEVLDRERFGGSPETTVLRMVS